MPGADKFAALPTPIRALGRVKAQSLTAIGLMLSNEVVVLVYIRRQQDHVQNATLKLQLYATTL